MGWREHLDGGKRYTDPKFGFTVIDPLVRNWELEQTEPGFLLFVNRFLKSTLAVMAFRMPHVVEDIHDLEVQAQITFDLVRSLKQKISGASDFKYGSSEKIWNPHNGVKGFQLIFLYKMPGQDIEGRYVTYVCKQIHYDMLAMATAQYYDSEDRSFFEPVIQSFTFEA